MFPPMPIVTCDTYLLYSARTPNTLEKPSLPYDY